MSDFFDVPENDVIAHGRLSYDRRREFIIYRGKDNSIRVNAYFSVGQGVYSCCAYYDRKLCDTADGYDSLTEQEIQSQAYGAYMDGAR